MRRLLRFACALAAATLAPALAEAQTPPPSVNGLGDLILNLSRTISGSQQRVVDQLFSGRIDATIIDFDSDTTNFAGADVIAFGLSSLSRGGTPLIFSGNRGAFDTWVEQNADTILAILFPVSLTESATGTDIAQSHAQELLVHTALAAGRRGDIGGRIEYERFEVEGSTGNALQGLFRKNVFVVNARMTRLQDSLHTNSWNVGANFHPSWRRSFGVASEARAGLDAFANLLYSRSEAVDFGSIDYGAGPWGSVRTTVGETTIGFGSLLLGSKTRLPGGLIDDGYEFVARAINDRPLKWDVTYGGFAEYPLTPRVFLSGNLLQTRSVKSYLGAGRTSELFLVSLGFAPGGDSRVDFGYRFSRGGDRFSANAFFMNAQFLFDSPP